MKKNYIHSAFLNYLEEQQGKGYVNEQDYNLMNLNEIRTYEEEHFKDFCVEFVENKLKEMIK